MATHDYLIDNQTRSNFRIDLNNVLSAIVSNNSNPTEPTTRFAFMWWVDTTAGVLKQRNSSNTAWVDILDLTSGASVSTGINDLVDAVLDTILKNIALGEIALINNTTGQDNTAVGYRALESNTTGNMNTAVGNYALNSNTTGNFNSAVGERALQNNTTGAANSAVGQGALQSNTTGVVNSAVGQGALQNNTTGVGNSAVGERALQNNTTGVGNSAVGEGAGNNITTENDTITLGANLDSIGSDYFTMGKGTGADRVYNQFTANATWTRASDERIKKEIETNEDCGLGFINDLRTVTYKFKAPSELDPKLSEYDKDNDKPSHDKKMYGFIAQEVKEALENHNIKDFAGWHVDDLGKDKLQGISYEMFVMPLVKSVQELSEKNQALVIENQDLSDRIDEQNAAIDAMMLRLEALENND